MKIIPTLISHITLTEGTLTASNTFAPAFLEIKKKDLNLSQTNNKNE